MRTLHFGPLLGWIAAVGLGPSAFAAAERTAFLYRNGEQQQGALIHDYADLWAEYVDSVDRFRFIETARSGETIELLDAGHPVEGDRRSGPAGRRPVRPGSGYGHGAALTGRSQSLEFTPTHQVPGPGEDRSEKTRFRLLTLLADGGGNIARIETSAPSP
jgi:hypothetical protein